MKQVNLELNLSFKKNRKREFLKQIDKAVSLQALIDLIPRLTTRMKARVSTPLTGDHDTVNELRQMVTQVFGYTDVIERDVSKPNGTPGKLINVPTKQIGWSIGPSLIYGLQKTYSAFLTSVI